MEALSRWWEKKYKLPSNHELFQDRTTFDLLTEYYVDAFEKKPIEAQRNEQGEIQFSDTGDAMIDKWEEQIAAGETPDLFEAFDEESIQHMEKMRQVQRDRDPYQGQSMKDMVDRLERHAKTEGLHLGRQAPGMTPEKKKLLDELFNTPTFGGNPDDE